MAVKKIYLDETDNKILALLSKYARKSYQEIGEAVGMTRSSVRERVLRMEDAGAITGYRTEISSSVTGKSIHAIISFKRNSNCELTDNIDKGFIKFLNNTPEVACYWKTYGDLDFFIEAVCASKEELDGFLAELRNYGFGRTHIIVTSVKKEYYE